MMILQENILPLVTQLNTRLNNKEEIMSQFTKSFLWRFILDIILLGIFVRLLQSVILAILSRSMETYSTPFLVIEAIVVSAISMLFICFITYWNIGVISKKGCYDYPMDSDKWFRNFAFINIGINLISTTISFIQWRENVAEQNARLDKYAENTYLTEAVEQSRQQISSMNTTLIICLIIENVIGIVILFLLLPKLKNRYNEC